MGDFGLILKHKSLIQLHTEAVAGGEKAWATGRGDDSENKSDGGIRVRHAGHLA